MYDPARLRQLTQGPDTGAPRLWDYQSTAAEDNDILNVNFWRGAGIRNGALVQLYGEGAYVLNIFAMTSQGLVQSGLDVMLDRIVGNQPGLPFQEQVRRSMCDLLQCGG